MGDTTQLDNSNEEEAVAPIDSQDTAEILLAQEVDPPEDSPETQLSKLEGEIITLKDQTMRLAAELDNTRRRAEREKLDSSKFAITGFARDLIGIVDIFDRAISTAPENAQEASAEAVASLINGVTMTEKELIKVLERHGVIRIYPKGEKFDPNQHQAIAEVPGTTEPQGVVVDVAQPGFMIGDRVLRAAMVTVSNGAGAKAKTQDDSQVSRAD